MATTIKLKNGSGAPLASDLVQGEPALDLTNKRLYTEDSGGTVIEIGTTPTSLNTTGTVTFGNLSDGSITVTAFVDEDNMASDSATLIPTQQSVKAYVDSQVASADTLAELSDTNITTPADGALLFYDTGTSNWIDNVVSGDITIADTGVAAIEAGVIVNADVNASAAIDVSKTALTAGTGLTLTTNTLSVDAAQTQITQVGTLTSFASTGIDDNATSTAITIDSTGQTMIQGSTTAFDTTAANNGLQLYYETDTGLATLGSYSSGGSTSLTFHTNSGGGASSEAMRINSSGVVGFSYGISEQYNAVSDSSGTTTVDLSTGTNFSSTLSANTTFAFTNPVSTGNVSAFTLKIVQDSSASGYTVTWPTSVDWPSATAPTLTATASAVDYFVFITHDGGTTYYGFTAGQALG